MSIQRRNHFMAVAAAALALSACDTSTESGESALFNFSSALGDYEAVDVALATDGFTGFQALAGRTPFSASGAAVSAAGAIGTGRFAEGDAFMGHLAERLTHGDPALGPAGAPIISEFHRGATFVYDPETDDYVVDPDRTGAPATGVRFIIYTVDAAGRPIVDREIGHADLVDEGDRSVEDVVLRMTVVERENTILDYQTALDDTGSGGTLSVAGFLFGGNVRLDFDIDATGSDYGTRSTLDLDFELRIAARSFRVAGRVRGAEEGSSGEGEIELTATHGAESFRLEMMGENGIIDGSIELDGDLFATVSGPEDDPVFLGSTGQPLTGHELLVLWYIVDNVEDIFDLLEDLIDPVDELVFLGAIL